MTEGAKKKRSPLQLPEELVAALRIEQSAFSSQGDRPPSFGALLLEAWGCYKRQKSAAISDKIHNSDETPPSVPPKLGVIFSKRRPAPGEIAAELHEKLDRILAGGIAAKAITQNIEAFDLLTELSHGKGGPDPGKPARSLDEGIAQAEREAEEIGRSIPDIGRTKRAIPARKRKPRAAGGGGHR